MAGDVVGGNGGTGENELAGRGAPVDGPADMVPDGGFQLPFVDQSGRVAFQDGCRIRADHPPGVVVHVEQHLALCRLHGGSRLPGRLGTFDENRAGSSQQFSQLGIDDPWQVGHWLSGKLGVLGNSSPTPPDKQVLTGDSADTQRVIRHEFSG